MDQANTASALSMFLADQEAKDTLRFITCGSVDDGKSTLIGRLLYDSKMIFEDQLADLHKESAKSGNAGDDIDYSLLLDGLEAEREQGITIDVAYRFFATEKRRFIVADTPGHEQYTRNMATGASTAHLAIILVDARKGILTQTRRHSLICSLVGIRNIVVAINKMDLVGYSQSIFASIAKDYEELAQGLGFASVQTIPLSALKGDNVMDRSQRMNWYEGPTLREALETAPGSMRGEGAFRFPVQWVNRPNLDFRGFAGTVAGGAITPGTEVVALPSARTSRIKSISTFDGALPSAETGQAVTLELEDEIDISRGDMICAVDDRATTSDQVEARLIWMSENPLFSGRPYLFKLGMKMVPGMVTRIKHTIDINTNAQEPAQKLELNDIGVVNIKFDDKVAFDPYNENRLTGSMIVVDRLSNETAGAGMIDFSLRRADNIHWQATDVTRERRAEQKLQKPRVLWFTGLSGSGKSTIANLIEKRLFADGRHTYMLDGDNVRHGLNKDLGFTEADRVENIRRISEVSKLMADAGLIVLVSFISPFRSERHMARAMMQPNEFVEIFIDTPLELCEERDPKGLYKKARAGEIKNFTGIDSRYEAPQNAEIHIKTEGKTAEACTEELFERLKQYV
ncbi:MAG: sulfate adenylyltransferase subunit CysN [Pseudomonadota bacterium]